jgi:hypothetical protein
LFDLAAGHGYCSIATKLSDSEQSVCQECLLGRARHPAATIFRRREVGEAMTAAGNAQALRMLIAD